MYRALLYPRKFFEIGEDGRPVHYNADTGKPEHGVFYTDNGFWDTYRTVYPFLSILVPELAKEMADGFLNYAEETGWLPKWLSPGEIGMMPGTLVESVIAELAVKGIIDKERRKSAYDMLLKSAYKESANSLRGRAGVAEYIRYGYIPNDFGESVNHTCDCAYGDFCISLVARLEGDEEEATKLLRRSKNYVNLFDSKVGFLRGKDRKGNFSSCFDPYAWGGDYCEGGAWQNGFSVCHDIEGLAELYGGKSKLIEKLDELFAAEPIFTVGAYGREIHEMSEMASADFGQCAISNQPSFHIPWMYAAMGAREKTEYWVERLVNEEFSSAHDGFAGDEDNGTMACWYLFACMGFYPLCPAKAEYVTAKPLFDAVEVNGKRIERYASAKISHADLVLGMK